MDPPPLYTKYHIDRDYEMVELFENLASRFDIRNALYPGSFVHVTPSLVFPRVVYVDSTKKAPAFFKDPGVLVFIKERKTYPGDPELLFYPQDYTKPFPEPEASFDLLISLYAGFVSQAGKPYLRSGGILLANSSHGDVSMASIDPDYEFIGVINRRGNRYLFSEKNLDAYFVPKRDVQVTRDLLTRTGRGLGYTKSASFYLFRKN